VTDQRRRDERQAVQTTAVVMEVRDGGRTLLGATRNISTSGLFVECEGAPAVDSQVQLVLGTHSPALRAYARVVRLEAGGFGATFLDDSPEGREEVELFVKKCIEQLQPGATPPTRR
jgi:hypothetical protein